MIGLLALGDRVHHSCTNGHSNRGPKTAAKQSLFEWDKLRFECLNKSTSE